MSDTSLAPRPSIIAHNVRRLMARDGLTYDDVVAATGLDARTLRGILHGKKRPHAKTLRRLADGLGVGADELFLGEEGSASARLDAASNPAIEQAVADHPGLFEDWSPHEFAELASRVGAGGGLTAEGARVAAAAMNANRRTIDRARVLLESDQAEALRTVVDALYERAASSSRS
ncbi:helix-turn-helix transcriptional regulator [Botrimarina sp.]|uniref:helix-turn-helix domain-containing protein n=1 Tax=Botrimarina sp. TaxID=2795802 RepID=UPI0032EBF92E